MACVVFLDGGDDEITEPDFFGFASELGLWAMTMGACTP